MWKSSTLEHTLAKRISWEIYTPYRLYDGSDLIDGMVEAWCFGCCQANQGLPVGFLLLPYSVLYIVESLYLLYFLLISWFIRSRRWCMDMLRVFHTKRDTKLSALVKYLYWPFQGGTSLWIICVIFVLCLSCFRVCSL